MKPISSSYTDDLTLLSPEEYIEKYGLEQLSAGAIFDPEENCRFDSLASWASHKENEDDIDVDDQPSFEKIRHKYKFDDD